MSGERARFLVVDDELSMREFLSILLTKEGYEVQVAENGARAMASLSQEVFDVVVTDLKLPDASGIDVLHRVKELSSETQVVVITAFATTETAIEAMKKGAYDYITKPFKVDELRLIFQKALEKRFLLAENMLLKKEISSRYDFGNIIGRSRPMQEVFELIKRVAPTKANVLISGESGTGKELVAKAIHFNSPRKDKPFVTVNCGAIPENLIESELFGHIKGSFTGAITTRRGLFESARNGSIFLDEIGELPIYVQAKLLRVLQHKSFLPVGSDRPTEVDVRIIAASNRNLAEEVKKGQFREDLFYRLNVIQIHLPPLRDRRDDIPLLIRHFLKRFNGEIGKFIRDISPDAFEVLMAYSYEGNVRELENVMERAITLEASDIITMGSLPQCMFLLGASQGYPLITLPSEGLNLDTLLAGVERDLLLQALKRTGVRKEAAQLLGISFRSIRYRLEKLGVHEEEFVGGSEEAEWDMEQ